MSWISERGWVMPDRGGACFDQVPRLVEHALTGSPGPNSLAAAHELLDVRYEHVLLIYFDAFGGSLPARHAGHPLLARAAAEGVLTELTSQFPSTTAAHMTTVHTGLPVQQHGLYEWFVLEPRLNRLIAPLLFSFAGDNRRHSLDGHLDPLGLYPTDTIYGRLAAAGVPSFAAQPAEFAFGRPNEVLLAGSEIVPFVDPGDGLDGVVAALATVPTGYGFVYIDAVDSLMHHVGPEPATIDPLVDRILTQAEAAIARLPAGTLVLLTADHGMTPVSPERTLYLNRLVPGLAELLARGADGEPLAPAGSCRDLFLHTRAGQAEAVVELIGARLGDLAEVRLTAELVADGVFGPDVSEAFLERLAQVVVLPRLGEAVYWYAPDRFVQHLHGQHGGLTPEEALVPLIAMISP